MRKVLTEQGLSIKLSELYDLVQDCADGNFISLVKSVVYEPGLRIAEGDEFLVTQNGTSIDIKLGGIVFQNYDVFLPTPEETSLSIPLASVSQLNVSGSKYKVYIALGEEETHPQRQSGTTEPFYTVQRNTIACYLLPETGGLPNTNAYLLAEIEILDESEWLITDHRYESVLKLISHYTNEGWSHETLPTKVTDVEARFFALEDYRHVTINGIPIDRQTLPIDRRIGSAIEVTWPTPNTTELDAVSGIIYYKVEATPMQDGAPWTPGIISQIVPIDRIAAEASLVERVGCTLYCDLGMRYEVTVRKVKNILNMAVSDPSDAVSIEAGVASSFLPITPLSVSVEYSLGSTDFVKIIGDAEQSRDTVFRIFVREYSGTTYTKEDLDNPAFLVYEGGAPESLYRTRSLDNDGITVLFQVRGRCSELLRETLQSFEFSSMFLESEDIVVFSIPESSTGWPGPTVPNGQALAADIYIPNPVSTAIITPQAAHLPHNRQAGDMVSLFHCPSLPSGFYEITGSVDEWFVIDHAGAGTPGSDTCDLRGNASATNMNPVVLTFGNDFIPSMVAPGAQLEIANSTDAATIPDGTYDVTDVNVGGFQITIDHDGTGGAPCYCDAYQATEIDLFTLKREEDCVLSKIMVEGYQDQKIHDQEGWGHNAARYTVSSGIIEKTLDVSQSGSGTQTFYPDSDDIISAGDTITVSLKRRWDVNPAINPSGYKVYLYFKKVL